MRLVNFTYFFFFFKIIYRIRDNHPDISSIFIKVLSYNLRKMKEHIGGFLFMSSHFYPSLLVL